MFQECNETKFDILADEACLDHAGTCGKTLTDEKTLYFQVGLDFMA